MGLLTHTELHPLQEARRLAEEHLDAIRSIAQVRGEALERNDEAEADRYQKDHFLHPRLDPASGQIRPRP
jgi:hypothetical protein